jgi:hypothetical protein
VGEPADEATPAADTYGYGADTYTSDTYTSGTYGADTYTADTYGADSYSADGYGVDALVPDDPASVTDEIDAVNAEDAVNTPADLDPAGTDGAIWADSLLSAGPDASPDPPDITEPAAFTSDIAEPEPTEAPVPEPVAATSAELPVPSYDDLSLPSLRARLRGLDADQVRTLAAYERAHAARPDVVTMFERRIIKLTDAG